MRTQLTLVIFFTIVLALLLQRRNWPNVVFRSDLTFRWYSIETLQVTEQHTWPHAHYDLQRIARYASLPKLTETVIPCRPTHTYIPPCEGVEVGCSSFVRVCCTLCLTALTHRESMTVGILMSKRTDDRPGNVLAMATCRLHRAMTPTMICEEIVAAISRPATTSTTALEFFNWYFANNLVFNNWRNIETMNRRAPHLRLLSQHDPIVVDFSLARQELKMSHDGTGWYIVERYVWFR